MNGKRTLAVATAMLMAGSVVGVVPATTSAADAATSAHHVQKKEKTLREREAVRNHVVRLALSEVGKRYVMGGDGPRDFDCSGLVRYTYQHVIHKTLPHSAAGQDYATRTVSRRHLKRGDLLFFYHNNHVGIYIGHGKFVNAENPHAGVRVERLNSYWRHELNGTGRIVIKH